MTLRGDMPEAPTCPRCGAPLPSEGWAGLCPTCLVRVSVEGNAEGGMQRAESPQDQTPSPLTPFAPDGRGEPLRRFGDYELLEEIGRGGMGVVYRARQVSLNRPVAVKMIASGELASPEFVQRFHLEAEATAGLQHPNIVAIHEVGVHKGQHFYSMDYVEGQTLAERVLNNPVPPELAADYLKTIAEAVHYAHQRGILHRDLKPSNVLIDSLDQPHLTDFGLAKRLTGDSDLTLTGQVLGSPNYMPPEQALGRRQAATIACDVYSLGAILYFLLTGRPPFAAESLTEILQQVLHSEPVSPRLLNPTVPRDLETICLKCMSKEPERRYGSVLALAEDLDRFLRGEPVQARPVGVAGKAWRWCRRNPGLASLAGGSLILLLALAIGAPIAALRINQERHKAEAARRNETSLRQQAQVEEKTAQREAFKSQQVAEFLKNMLQGVGPSVARGRDTTLLREILGRTAERVGKDLAGQPEVEAELRNTIGEVYFALGQFDRAELMHEVALRLRSNVLGKDDIATAESLHNLAKALCNQGRLAEAERLERNALVIRTRVLGKEHPEVATALSGLGKVLFQQGRRAEAESAYRQALVMRMKLFGEEHLSVAESLDDLASILFVQRKYDESERTSRRAIAMSRNLLGNEQPALVSSLNGLAKTLVAQGKMAEAEPLYRESLTMSRQLWTDGHPSLDQSLNNLIDLLLAEQKYTAAETLCREDLATAESHLGKESPGLAVKLNRLAGVLRAEGKLSESLELEQTALDLARKLARTDPSAFEQIISEMADGLSGQKRDADAEVRYRDALANARLFATNDPIKLEKRMAALAGCLRAEKNYSQAEQLCREALASARTFETNLSGLPTLELRLEELAKVLDAEGKLPEYETLCREALELKRKRVGNDGYDVAQLLCGLAYVLQREGRLSEAEAALRESISIANKAGGNQDQPGVAQSLYGLSWVLVLEHKLDEAENAARQALAVRRELNLQTKDEPAVADSLSQLAKVLFYENKLAEAESAAREGAALYQRDVPNDWRTFSCYTTLGTVLKSARKYPHAEDALRDAVAIMKKSPFPEHSAEMAETLSWLGWVLHAQDKFADAEVAAREALALRRKIAEQSGADTALADGLYQLAVTLKSGQKLNEAESLARECLAICERKSPQDWQTFNCQSTLGSILVAEHQYAGAEPFLLSAYEGLAKYKPANPWDVRARVQETVECLVQVYEGSHQPDRAAEWRQKLAGP